MKSQFEKYIPKQYPVREWPTLAASLFAGTQAKNPIVAWNKVIELLKDFRQADGLGRNPGQQTNRPGRSRWPEPETIRNVTKKRMSKHQRTTHIPENAFPRAEFGLPIVFQFKDKRQDDPFDTVLYPDGGHERLASPLVMKPVAVQEGGQAISVILHLKTKPLSGVDLRKGEESLSLPAGTVIRDPGLAKYTDSPLQISNAGSAIEAFLNYADSQGIQNILDTSQGGQP